MNTTDEIRLYWPLGDRELDRTQADLIAVADRGIPVYCRREGVTPLGMAHTWQVTDGSGLPGWEHFDGLVLTCLLPVLVHASRRETVEEQIRALNGQGVTDADIAVKIGLSYSTVRRYRDRLGLPGRGFPGRRRDSLNVPETLRKVGYWHGQGFRDGEIASKLGISSQSVARYRRQLGLKGHLARAKVGDWDKDQQDALVRFWHGRGLSDGRIGRKIGLAQSSVTRVRNRLGLPVVNPGAGGRPRTTRKENS